MGRLVHCQETCSHMKDFKESVGSIFRNAMWRGYPRRLVQSVWSRFLFQRWHSVDIRVKELRVWFAKIWSFLARNGAQKVPNPLKPSLPLSAMEGSIAVLGVVTSSRNSSSTTTSVSEHACALKNKYEITSEMSELLCMNNCMSSVLNKLSGL